jgi:ribonuclease HII
MPFLVCGLDEVGRGALAGPLIAVASLFKLDEQYWSYLETRFSPIRGVNDSKKLTSKKRREVFERLLRSEYLVDFGIGEISVDEINSFGIEWANRLAFIRAVKDLSQMPHFVLVDGDNPLEGWNIVDQKFEPKADGLWWPVGAASILAKVIRDSYMAELGHDNPEYDWDLNAGYGSDAHRAALLEFGATAHHRTKFIRNIIGGTRE